MYNLQENVVAIAQTNFNATDSHIQEISNGSIPGVTSTASGVSVTQTATETHLQTSVGGYNRYSSTLVTAYGSPTFNLGGGTGTGSATATATHEACATILRPPFMMSFSGILTGGMAVVLLTLGGVLIVLM